MSWLIIYMYILKEYWQSCEEKFILWIVFISFSILIFLIIVMIKKDRGRKMNEKKWMTELKRNSIVYLRKNVDKERDSLLL